MVIILTSTSGPEERHENQRGDHPAGYIGQLGKRFKIGGPRPILGPLIQNRAIQQVLLCPLREHMRVSRCLTHDLYNILRHDTPHMQALSRCSGRVDLRM